MTFAVQLIKATFILKRR